jgi:hypothetical protein
MGACINHKKDEQFSMNDLIGMDKYYSLMPKRKADVLHWMIDSEGPWKTPDSFLCFQQIDIKNNPVRVSNEDEIRSYAAKSKSSINNDLKRTSSLHVDQKEIQMNLNTVNSTLSLGTSTDINNEHLLDWPSDW